MVMECNACHKWSASSADSFLMEEVRVQPTTHSYFSSRKADNSLAAMLRANTSRGSPEGYKCDACGAIDTTHFRDGLRRLPQVYAVHVNRTLPNGVRTAFPNREHGRRILTKLALLAQSRCAESVAFEDTLDLKDMLLYQRKAALDHR